LFYLTGGYSINKTKNKTVLIFIFLFYLTGGYSINKTKNKTVLAWLKTCRTVLGFCSIILQ